MPEVQEEVKVEPGMIPVYGPTFSMPRVERVEKVNKLKELSKEIFGASSRWRKILDDGVTTAVTRQVVKEKAPGEEGTEDTYTTVHVEENGIKQYYVKRYTLDSLLEYLLDVKSKRDAIMAQLKALQDEQKAKAMAEKAKNEALDEAKGSAHGGL